MTLREIRKFRFTCDGWYPDGHAVCGVKMDVEAQTKRMAESQARETGWTEDYRGWLCNARDGHRTP